MNNYISEQRTAIPLQQQLGVGTTWSNNSHSKHETFFITFCCTFGLSLDLEKKGKGHQSVYKEIKLNTSHCDAKFE